MKKNIFLITILFACCSSSYLQAQLNFHETLQQVHDIAEAESRSSIEIRSNMEMDKSLQGFLETPLMEKFKDLKVESESLIITFKTKQDYFSVEDITLIKDSYVQFANEYNKLLVQIKADFMNRKQRKAISKNPNWYAATLELQFRNLEDLYSQNLLQEVANITGSDEYSAFPLVAIIGMIKLTRDFVNQIARIKYEGKQIRETHLDDFFIRPYSMRDWSELYPINVGPGDTESLANPFIDSYENRSPFEEVPDTTRRQKN